MGIQFAGAVLRPHAFLLDEKKEAAEKILKAVKQVGIQLIQNGAMSKETLKVISKPIASEEELIKRYNDLYGKVTTGSC